MKTQQEKFAAALTARGEREVPSKSRKYRTFTRGDNTFYFLGKGGALRTGHNSSYSYPVISSLKAELLAEADALPTKKV